MEVSTKYRLPSTPPFSQVSGERRLMPTIHFLNVKQGDCSVITHYSGHVTVIDVCNAKPTSRLTEAISARAAWTERGLTGNFNQKKYPVNPTSYLQSHGITSVFRFIATHPDMDSGR